MLPALKSEDSCSKLDSSTQRRGITPSVEDSPRTMGAYTGEDFYRGVGAAPRKGVGAAPQRGVGVAPRKEIDAAPKNGIITFNSNNFYGGVGAAPRKGVGTAPRGVEEVSNHCREGDRCLPGRVARRTSVGAGRHTAATSGPGSTSRKLQTRRQGQQPAISPAATSRRVFDMLTFASRRIWP